MIISDSELSHEVGNFIVSISQIGNGGSVVLCQEGALPTLYFK